MRRVIIMSTLAMVVATGCANMNNTQKGATIGAIAGALIGKGTGDHDKSRYIWGAAVGALAGSAIGNYMDQQEQALREELAGSGITVVRDGDQIHLQLPSNITFATGNASISPNFGPILQDVARVLNEYEKTTMIVAGHTDSTGEASYNQQLSVNRATAVQNRLLTHGVDSRRLTVVGYGETMPIAANNTNVGREQNRRVELTIVPNQA